MVIYCKSIKLEKKITKKKNIIRVKLPDDYDANTKSISRDTEKC